MAIIQKTAKGYRAQIKKLGDRDSQVFPTRREALEWAARRELEISTNKNTPEGARTSLRAVLRRYAEEISPSKRGKGKELIRLAAFERYALPLDLPVSEVSGPDIAKFRDSRLKAVKASSVLRELNALSSVFEVARKEWGLIDKNPCKEIRRPSQRPPTTYFALARYPGHAQADGIFLRWRYRVTQARYCSMFFGGAQDRDAGRGVVFSDVAKRA